MTAQQGTAREVLLAFLRLGLTSFGGPIGDALGSGWLHGLKVAAVAARCRSGTS